MNADSSPRHPSRKRAILAGCALWIFHLLRMFWLTELALLLVVLYGLHSGWSTPRQWSDGLFIAASLQLVAAGATMYGTRGEALDASWVRYINHGNITETHHELVLDSLRRMNFGVRAFLGAILILLLAALVLWV